MDVLDRGQYHSDPKGCCQSSHQIIASVVEEDVGFGEKYWVPTEEIWTRVNQSLEAVDMGKYRKHSQINFPVDRSSVLQLPVLWQWGEHTCL